MSLQGKISIGAAAPHRQRRGAVLLLLVLSIPLIIGVLTLALDLGWTYLQEQKLRGAGQAAATAAANRLAAGGTVTQAIASAKAFGLANGIQLDDSDVTVNPYNSNPYSVRVHKSRMVTLFWGPILGWKGLNTEFDVIGVGNADVTQLHRSPATAGAASGVIPLGIPHADMFPILTGSATTASQIAPLIFQSGQQFSRGQRYLLKTGSQFKIALPGLPSGSSNEGPLDFPGVSSGAAKYRLQLTAGVGSQVAVGDLVATYTGNMVGPTQDGVGARVAADTASTWTTPAPFSARTVIVPIVKSYGQVGADDLGTGVPGLKNIFYVFQGGQVVQIIGLAKFFLDPYTGAEGTGAVTGVFIEYVGPPPKGQFPG